MNLENGVALIFSAGNADLSGSWGGIAEVAQVKISEKVAELESIMKSPLPPNLVQHYQLEVPRVLESEIGLTCIPVDDFHCIDELASAISLVLKRTSLSVSVSDVGSWSFRVYQNGLEKYHFISQPAEAQQNLSLRSDLEGLAALIGKENAGRVSNYLSARKGMEHGQLCRPALFGDIFSMGDERQLVDFIHRIGFKVPGYWSCYTLVPRASTFIHFLFSLASIKSVWESENARIRKHLIERSALLANENELMDYCFGNYPVSTWHALELSVKRVLPWGDPMADQYLAICLGALVSGLPEEKREIIRAQIAQENKS